MVNNEKPCLADTVADWQRDHNITFDDMFRQACTLSMCLAAQLFDDQGGEENSEGEVTLYQPLLS